MLRVRLGLGYRGELDRDKTKTQNGDVVTGAGTWDGGEWTE